MEKEKKDVEVIFRTNKAMVDFIAKRSEELGESKSSYLRGLIRKDSKKK